MSTQPKHFLTPEEYLEIERHSQTKSEYYNGELFAMSGASKDHCQLGFRLNGVISSHLRAPCRGFTSDMRVRIASGPAYVYPDLTVVCGEPPFADDAFDSLLNPTLVIEILSPTTENRDRIQKLKWYRSIASVQEYLLIAQDRPEVELYRRGNGGMWLYLDSAGMDGTIELTSVGFTLRLRDLYEGILADAEATA